MKIVRRSLAVLGLVLAGLIVLVLWLPARWLVPLAEARLHGARLEQVDGLLWHGRAGRILAPDGEDLGQLRWTLARSALWGRLRLDVAWQRPGWQAAGHLERDTRGRQVWTDVRIRGDLAGSGRLLATGLGVPRGQVDVRLDRAVLQANWPMQLTGQADWRQAVVLTGDGAVPIGHLRVALEGHDGVLRARLADVGDGPLAVAGEGALSPLGWRAQARLRVRGRQPALEHWLARVGRRGADGAWHLQRSAGLARPAIGESRP